MVCVLGTEGFVLGERVREAGPEEGKIVSVLKERMPMVTNASLPVLLRMKLGGQEKSLLGILSGNRVWISWDLTEPECPGHSVDWHKLILKNPNTSQSTFTPNFKVLKEYCN